MLFILERLERSIETLVATSGQFGKLTLNLFVCLSLNISRLVLEVAFTLGKRFAA